MKYTHAWSTSSDSTTHKSANFLPNLISFLLGIVAVTLSQKWMNWEQNRSPKIQYTNENTQLEPWKYQKKVHSFGRVHVAVGYALANAVFIETLEGVVIVDSMENSENFMEAFEGVDWKFGVPSRIGALVYTSVRNSHLWLDSSRVGTAQVLYRCFR